MLPPFPESDGNNRGDEVKNKRNREAAVAAAMEGACVVLRNIGKKVTVSEMELVILCNMARLACLEDFARTMDGELLIEVIAVLARYRASLKQCFASPENPDGLHRIMQSCAAMLGEERLGRYVVNDEDAEAMK